MAVDFDDFLLRGYCIATGIVPTLDSRRDEEEATVARHMVKVATQVYKQLTGVYPVKVGLDYFTRMRDYSRKYGETYVDMVLTDVTVPPSGNIAEAVAHVERVGVMIEPAVFGQPEYYPDAPIIKNPPKEGKDEAYAERDGQFMSILFSEHGYDAILWD